MIKEWFNGFFQENDAKLKQLRVLLIDCTRPLNHKEFSCGWGTHHPPVGLLAIASYVKRSDFSDCVIIKIVDSSVDYTTIEELKLKTNDFKPDVVGLRCMHSHTEQFHFILNYLKSLATPPITIAGGPYANSSPKKLLDSEANLDIIVNGDGEETFLNLLQTIYHSRSLSDTAGIYFRNKENTVIATADRPRNTDLDLIGFPNWNELNFEPYAKILGQARVFRKVAPILTSRGCPYRCTYCHDLFQKKFRMRSPENIVQELELLQNLGVEDIAIIDDIFNFDNSRIFKLFNLISKRNLKLRFYYPNGLRADRMPNELIDAMVDGGSIQFVYALESGSERIQKLIKKNLNLEKFNEAVNHTLSRNVMVNLFLMVGFPTETMDDAMQTLRVLGRYSTILFPQPSVLNAFPGTEIHRWLEQNPAEAEAYNLDSQPGYGTLQALTPGTEIMKIVKAFRTRIFTDYFFKKERLHDTIRIQKRFLTDAEILARFQNYLQKKNLTSLDQVLKMGR